MKTMTMQVLYGKTKEEDFSSVEDRSSSKKKLTPSTRAGSEKETQHQNLKTPEATDGTQIYSKSPFQLDICSPCTIEDTSEVSSHEADSTFVLHSQSKSPFPPAMGTQT